MYWVWRLDLYVLYTKCCKDVLKQLQKIFIYDSTLGNSNNQAPLNESYGATKSKINLLESQYKTSKFQKKFYGSLFFRVLTVFSL